MTPITPLTSGPTPPTASSIDGQLLRTRNSRGPGATATESYTLLTWAVWGGSLSLFSLQDTHTVHKTDRLNRIKDRHATIPPTRSKPTGKRANITSSHGGGVGGGVTVGVGGGVEGGVGARRHPRRAWPLRLGRRLGHRLRHLRVPPHGPGRGAVHRMGQRVHAARAQRRVVLEGRDVAAGRPVRRLEHGGLQDALVHARARIVPQELAARLQHGLAPGGPLLLVERPDGIHDRAARVGVEGLALDHEEDVVPLDRVRKR
eukprot:scaffold31868_cov67-Phaeocystis_antarctica.AAC.6